MYIEITSKPREYKSTKQTSANFDMINVKADHKENACQSLMYSHFSQER